jgi:serine/threonine protein kinase
VALVESGLAVRHLTKVFLYSNNLHHEHIVCYRDRYVDCDAGILYILMEYCGGGDLFSVIKHAQKHNRPIPEDTISCRRF